MPKKKEKVIIEETYVIAPKHVLIDDRRTGLVPREETDFSVERMIALAIEKGVAVDSLERLLAMRRELKEEFARVQFYKAMALFQASCSTIKKTKTVNTKVGGKAYSYAPLESIVEQVKVPLAENGFSYSSGMTLDDKYNVTASIKVTHKDGHSEVTSMEVPLGQKTQIMSDSQVVAAAQTFAKRYAFCNAFGILTGDEDTDAVKLPAENETANFNPKGTITDAQNKILHAVARQLGLSEEGLNKRTMDLHGVRISGLSKEQATPIIDKMLEAAEKRRQNTSTSDHETTPTNGVEDDTMTAMEAAEALAGMEIRDDEIPN